MNSKDFKQLLRRTWRFIWEEDSFLSWAINVIIAFVLIKYIVYPGLGLALGTTHPVVAVVSGSMEHNSNFDKWWEVRGEYYEENLNISKEQFSEYSFKNGFNKGDIMVLVGEESQEIEIGDVIVYSSFRKDPIIHRTVLKWEDSAYHFQTKGDNVGSVQSFEMDIKENNVIGRAVARIPYLGWVKILFVCGFDSITGGQQFLECLLDE